jgi:alkanesulfonate monooxygenase SsuD/methylene tetrahydromethanopterin reductase-like flavin-dependent oxidoreductase (luciferase family)
VDRRFGEAIQIVDRMLCNEVTNFDGQYYQIKGTILSPRPIHKPRTPLTLGVTGLKAMELRQLKRTAGIRSIAA